MEFSLHLQEMIRVFFALLFALIFLCASINKANAEKRKGRRQQPPEAAGAWPVIGHLPLLGSNQLLHRTLGVMADKYGKSFMIRLGIHRALVINSLEVAKECCTTNDKIFATRPKSLAAKILAYDHLVIGFTPYGPYWRDVRKLVTVELLSVRRLELLKHVFDTEINSFIKELSAQCVKNGGPVVEMKEKFGDLTMNIIVRMLTGKRYYGSDIIADEESRRFQKAINHLFHAMGLVLISDTVPFLGWLDIVKGYTSKMKKTAREVDHVLENWVAEHRRRRLNGNVSDEEQDFIHVMLSAMDDGKIAAQDAHTAIKATCLSLILGGNDTTVATLTWALSLLLNNRHALNKAQYELSLHVGKHRQVEESDIKNLVYLQAIVKETLRLYPPAPLTEREATEDCTVSGFHIPAGTRLVLNMWKLHRDPRVWSNPLEFVPERFLNHERADLDVRGLHFEYLPFGSGRRKCPGISFALQVLHLTLARLLQVFELGTVSDTVVDMSEAPGFTVPKATPLEVVLTPRICLPCY